MSLPPERVSIKRKRDAESVDVLFIQDSKRAKTQFLFRRINGAHGDGIQPSLKPVQANGGSVGHLGPNTGDMAQAASGNERPRLQPRKFHLERSALARTNSNTSGPHEARSQKKLAVLVEQRMKQGPISLQAPEKTEVRGRSYQQSLPPSPTKQLSDVQKQHLRPRASAAELRWREEKWGPRGAASRSVSRGPTPVDSDAKELELAHALDSFAREQESRNSPMPDASTPDRKRPLKFQPRSSMAGRRLQPMNADSMDNAGPEDGESDFEYDTYERVPYSYSVPTDVSAASKSMLTTDNAAFTGQSVGILVIEHEDEELWASYQEDEDSDTHFETDDEDENAEDYYGNDYPEDELDSDDEYGRGAYGYRHAASDDEQFGEPDEYDERGMSGDEGNGLARNGGASSMNDFTSPVQHGGLHPY